MDVARRVLCATVAYAAAASLVGCSSPPPLPPPPPPPPPPTLVKASLQAGPAVNPDAARRPSPVVVRMYELKSTATLDLADMLALLDHDKDTLGDELTNREEFQLQAGQKIEIERRVKDETRVVAWVAFFRDYQRARWKASVPVKSHETVTVTVRLDGSAITITSP